jgi:hypothetical protein
VDGAAGGRGAVRQDGSATARAPHHVVRSGGAPSIRPQGSPALSDLPAPSASRLSRARWLDARLLIGLLLVLLSVVVGAKVVADADQRVRVWSVTRDLGVDTPLSDDDLQATSVNLSGSTSRYLAASQDLEGLVLTRPVARGELLPVSAVAHGDSGQKRRIVIEVDRFGVAGLQKGRVVDVYVVPEAQSGESPPPPELVLSSVTVGEDVKSGGNAFGGSGSKAGVTLLVDESQVPDLIDAVAHGDVYVAQVPAGATPAGASGS